MILFRGGIFALFAVLCPLLRAGSVTTVASPNGSNVVSLQLDEHGALNYQVIHNGLALLPDSPLGFVEGERDFSHGLRVSRVHPVEERREAYSLVAGVARMVNALHHRQSVDFGNAEGAVMTVDLDAGNEGVAFRYRLPEVPDGKIAVIAGERTGFTVPADAKGWIQPYSQSNNYGPAYEEFYHVTKPGEPPPDPRGGKARGWFFPALFEVPSAKAWILLTESGTGGDYCGCHLAADDKDGIYHIEFPFEDEGTRGVAHRKETNPRHALPWSVPWRVVVMSDQPGGIMNSTLVTDLAPPSEIEDTSWIKPGRASWSWWANPGNRPTRAGLTQLYADYVRGARAFGWEYSLLDAGWEKADLADLVKLAGENRVKLLVWNFAGDYYDPTARRRRLDELQRRGLAGVKIDFWCSDRQETMQAMMDTLRDAADRHLVVNFHGCTLPRGWQRTYPNLLTVEAVLGEESYMFVREFSEKAAEMNTILPFTRNVAGPMDFTPVGLKRQAQARLTTAAHELATALIFTSGIVHYADQPEVYAALPTAVQGVLKGAPAAWDETRCLVGEPGKMVVVARRAKSTWFIAGINGTAQPQEVELDLTPFGGSAKTVLIHEGNDSKDEFGVETTASSGDWAHQMPPRGGFILRLGN